MAVSTVRDIVRGAAQGLGALAVGEDVDSDIGALGLELLNGLMDESKARRFNITRVTRTTHTITANDEVYTIGTGGDITSIEAPVFVNTVNFVDSSTDPDMELPMSSLTDDAYAAITLKAQTSPYPSAYWYRLTTAVLGTLTLWPVPTSSTLSLAIYAPQAWGEFASLSTSWSMPPGFQRYLRCWLALEMAAPLEKEPSQWLLRSWAEAQRTVTASNFRPVDLQMDPGLIVQTGRGLYNIYSDSGG